MLNRVLSFSAWAFHCHSWPLLNWMPLSIRLNLSVHLGPISCMPTTKHNQ